MANVPLTPQGVHQKVDELYQLPDEQRVSEAESIRQDFKSWVRQNFDLNATERECLDLYTEEYVEVIGLQLFVAVKHKISVTMPDPPQPAARRPVRTDVNIEVEHDTSTGRTTFSGGVTIRLGRP